MHGRSATRHAEDMACVWGMLLRPSEPLGRWRRRGCHIMRLHRLPRSETARHHEAEFALPIEEEEEVEPLCIDSPLCPGP